MEKANICLTPKQLAILETRMPFSAKELKQAIDEANNGDWERLKEVGFSRRHTKGTPQEFFEQKIEWIKANPSAIAMIENQAKKLSRMLLKK